MELLGDRPHCRLQHAVNPVLDVHRVVLRLDVDIAGAALNRGVDGRVDEFDDWADVAGEAFNRQVVVAGFVFLQQLHLEAFGRFLEHALRALALLENRFDRRFRSDDGFDRRGQQHAELVDHRQVGRIGDDNLERLADAAVRHEVVAQHQIRRDRAEQFLIDPERIHIDEFEAIPFREPARLLNFGAMLGVGDWNGQIGVQFAHDPSTELNWNSGMYSASSRPAITTPMKTSRTGSTRVMNRSIFVSISSS